jgi:hypothetical protein
MQATSSPGPLHLAVRDCRCRTLDPEHIVRSCYMIGSKEEFDTFTERQTGSVPSLVIASHHRIDSNGPERSLQDRLQ